MANKISSLEEQIVLVFEQNRRLFASNAELHAQLSDAKREIERLRSLVELSEDDRGIM